MLKQQVVPPVRHAQETLTLPALITASRPRSCSSKGMASRSFATSYPLAPNSGTYLSGQWICTQNHQVIKQLDMSIEQKSRHQRTDSPACVMHVIHAASMWAWTRRAQACQKRRFRPLLKTSDGKMLHIGASSTGRYREVQTAAGLQEVNVVHAQPLQVAIHGRLDVRGLHARLPIRPQVLVPIPRHLLQHLLEEL